MNPFKDKDTDRLIRKGKELLVELLGHRKDACHIDKLRIGDSITVEELLRKDEDESYQLTKAFHDHIEFHNLKVE